MKDKENISLHLMTEQELKNESKRTYKCCICGETFEGYGNNALPVADGECCEGCNFSIVIPARFKAIRDGKDKGVFN